MLMYKLKRCLEIHLYKRVKGVKSHVMLGDLESQLIPSVKQEKGASYIQKSLIPRYLVTYLLI